MPAPGVDPLSDRPLDELVQTVSEQAVVVARKQVDLARAEMTSKVKQAGAGAAMLGGAGVLAALASGTGTAGLVLLLARRPGSGAALGVAGAYAGAGALLAREGLVRLREAGPLVPQETMQSTKENLGSAKRGTKSARKPARRAASNARKPTGAKQRQASGAKRRRPPAGARPSRSR